VSHSSSTINVLIPEQRVKLFAAGSYQQILPFGTITIKRTTTLFVQKGPGASQPPLLAPGISESYYSHEATLDRVYDIQLDQYALPCITSNTQLPKSHIRPKSSEFWFRRELIKVRKAFYRNISMTKLRSSTRFITAPLPREWQRPFYHQSYKGI
jgi:hypothetical protein